MNTALTLGLLAGGITALVAFIADGIISEREQLRALVLTISIAVVAVVMMVTGAWFGQQDGYQRGFHDGVGHDNGEVR